MRLGVNGWRLQGKATGVGRYLSNILRHWDSGASKLFDSIRVYTSRPIDRQVLDLPAAIELRVLSPDSRMLVWENLRLGPWIRDDVLFCPSHSRPLVTRAKVVVTAHDSTQFLHPELFPRSQPLYNRLYLWSARRAELVITDSRAALEDLARCCGVPTSKMRAVSMASAQVFGRVPDEDRLRETRRRLVDGGEPFFLFVGKFSGRRSVPLLFQAFAAFKRRTSHRHKLVLVGINVHQLEISRMLRELDITEDVHYPGYVSDQELNVLYNSTDALLSSSIYETVSLPVMEAQAAGAPVVCLDTPGMRETTGGAALLIRKFNVGEMSKAMERIARDTALRDELSQAGLERSRGLSWERTAAETMAVLEEAARMSPRTGRDEL